MPPAILFLLDEHLDHHVCGIRGGIVGNPHTKGVGLTIAVLLSDSLSWSRDATRFTSSEQNTGGNLIDERFIRFPQPKGKNSSKWERSTKTDWRPCVGDVEP